PRVPGRHARGAGANGPARRGGPPATPPRGNAERRAGQTWESRSATAVRRQGRAGLGVAAARAHPFGRVPAPIGAGAPAPAAGRRAGSRRSVLRSLTPATGARTGS